MGKKNKKIKMILCDMDGTTVEYPVRPFFSSWDGLSLALPKYKQKKWIQTRDKYVGRPSLHQIWFNEQIPILEGLSVKKAEKFLFPIPYSKGAKEFFTSLNGNYLKGIVSSGIDIVAKKIQEELNFSFYISNVLETKNGVFTGKGKNILGLEDKGKMVKKISEDYNIPLEQICFIGDSTNDIPVLEIVGLPIVFNPKNDLVKKKAKYSINDFRELNKILY